MRTRLPGLHPISRRHLEHLTGPNAAQAPSVDTVARRIQVDLLHARTLGWDDIADSVGRGLASLEAASAEAGGRFRTLGPDGQWTDGPASNDTLGRVMLALGETIAAAPDDMIVERASVLFSGALKASSRVLSLRGQAAVVLGCAAVGQAFAVSRPIDPRSLPAPAPRALHANETALRNEARATLGLMATRLHARVLDHARPGWFWAESTLTGESAILPRALIVGGRAAGADVMFRIGRQVLDWLIEVQTGHGGHLSLIGAPGWARTGERATFDQLPADATALLLAAEAAHDATGDPRYAEAMERAYGWFLGENDRRHRLVDPERGACADSLTRAGRNANEGVEATLAWLTAAEHIRELRRPLVATTTAPPPSAPATAIRARTVRASPVALPALRVDPVATG